MSAPCQPEILAKLEVIDKPLSTSTSAPELDARYAEAESAIPHVPHLRKRVSRLPPTPSVPSAGPSSPSRYLFVGVRSGHTRGVYTDWYQAERQLVDHPEPVFKTFSTRLAAEAYVAGWNGAGRHSLPSSSPRPLREHLAMNFPTSVSNSHTPHNPRRPTYHARLLSAPTDGTSNLPWTPSDMPDFYPSRPPLSHSTSSYRLSQVRNPSPLRLQVDEEITQQPVIRKAHSFMGIGGLLSPPASPEDMAKTGKVMDRERPTKPRNALEAGQWSSQTHRQFTGGQGLGLISPPSSPQAEKRGHLPRTASAPSGLWVDVVPRAIPATASPAIPPAPELDNAPKFSRSSLKKSNVIMPVAAPKHKTSRTSLLSPYSSPSSSQTSLVSNTSTSSTASLHTLRKQPSHSSFSLSRLSSQDRLSTLSATSARELQLNEEGLQALDSLSPPRPAFMRKSSNSSLSSMSSLTSASSSGLREEVILEEVGVTGEEDVGIVISCTKSDGDADGSVESSSLKSGSGDGVFAGGEKKKKGGLFKRFSKALKLEKKDVLGQENGRRPSV